MSKLKINVKLDKDGYLFQEEAKKLSKKLNFEDLTLMMSYKVKELYKNKKRGGRIRSVIHGKKYDTLFYIDRYLNKDSELSELWDKFEGNITLQPNEKRKDEDE